MLIAIALAALVGLAAGLAVSVRLRRPSASGNVNAGPAQPAESPPCPADTIAEVVREAVDHLQLQVVVCDSDGAVVYRNTSALGLSGTHAGAIVDDHITRLAAQAADGGRIEELVELHGPPRVSLMLAAEPMPSGASVITIHDVSERVRTEAMRTDFVANISHELKTPIGAVAVLAEALLDETDDQVIQRVTQRIVDESHRGVLAIDDLLELSWIESAGPPDEIVDLQAVIQNAIARGRDAGAGRGVRVTASDPGVEIALRASSRQLASALGNLVENAVKYSDDRALVEVRTRVDTDAVEIMVVDQGVGIPARDLDRVFERFYRVDKARSRDTGGSGLGLAIVRHVATNHEGEISVRSQEGEGSTFVLRLPIGLVVSEDAPSTVAAGSAHG